MPLDNSNLMQENWWNGQVQEYLQYQQAAMYGFGIATIHQMGAPPQPAPAQNINAILEEFNSVLRCGIVEVVVTPRVYAELIAGLHDVYGLNAPMATKNVLTLNLRSGILLVRPEGSPTPNSVDFDAYIEDVDGKLP